MKRSFIILGVMAAVMAMGPGAETVRAQVPVTGSVTAKAKQGSAEMDRLNEECIQWNLHAPTIQRFNEVTKRLQVLAKDPNLMGQAYLRLGRNYANVCNTKLVNDSLAVHYLEQSLLYLDLPEENDLYSVALHNLAREYMYPSRRQNGYRALEYMIQSFELRPQGVPDMGDMFMFGWGVKQDLFLAANIYDICLTDGNTGSLDQFYYIDYFLNHINGNQFDTRAFEGMEYFFYSNFILRDSRKGYYSITMASELSLPSAMLELGLLYHNNMAGANEATNRSEGFNWLREASDQNYAPAILALSNFCQKYTIDPEEGDIYRKNAQGKYSTDALRTVNQKVRDLCRRASELGYVQAEVELGKMMMDAPQYHLGAPDYLEAAKWFTLAAQSSFSQGEEMLDVLQHKMDTAQVQHDPKSYAAAVKAGRSMATTQQYNHANILESILKNTSINHPRNSKSTPLKSTPTEEQMALLEKYNVPQQDVDDFILAIAYKAVYNEYVKLLKDMSAPQKFVNQSTRRFLQSNMTRLRIHAQEMSYCLIKESPWEEWNGK